MESQTPKVLPFPETDCTGIRHLADQLVHEWLNQALDNFELPFGDILCHSGTCAAHCETGNGSCNENQACDMPGDAVKHSAPAVKHLCYDELETSGNHLMCLPVGRFCTEVKQAHSRNRSSMEMNCRSLSCNALVTRVPHKQLVINNFSAGSTEFNAKMYVPETDQLYHSKVLIRHTKSETFLQHTVKEMDYLESNHTSNQSEHKLASGSLRVSDVTDLRYLLPANAGKAEYYAEKNVHEVLQKVDNRDGTMTQIQAPISELLSTASLVTASSAVEVEDMTGAFSAAVNASSDCVSAGTHLLADANSSSQDLHENIPCRVTHSSCDSFLYEDWNSTDSGSRMFLSSPEVQVSFLCFIFSITVRDSNPGPVFSIPGFGISDVRIFEISNRIE